MKSPKIVLSVLIAMGGCIPVYSSECPFPEDAGASVLIDYLKDHRPEEENACIDRSFEKLKSQLTKSKLSDEQVGVLIRFLDHKRLPSAAEQQGFAIHFSPTAEQYPAVGSIFLLGGRAINPLLSALRTPEVTPRFQENAALAWSLIYRDDPSAGVRALVQAATSQSDPARASNLRKAAISVDHNCPESVRRECDSELSR